MPIHFSITHPRTTPCYDPMNPSDPIKVEGTYSGAKPSKMWYRHGTGLPPTGVTNPWEDTTTQEITSIGAGIWSATAPAIAGNGHYWVQVWSIQPGSSVICDDVRTFCVNSIIPLPASAQAMSAAHNKKSKEKKKN